MWITRPSSVGYNGTPPGHDGRDPGHVRWQAQGVQTFPEDWRKVGEPYGSGRRSLGRLFSHTPDARDRRAGMIFVDVYSRSTGALMLSTQTPVSGSADALFGAALWLVPPQGRVPVSEVNRYLVSTSRRNSMARGSPVCERRWMAMRRTSGLRCVRASWMSSGTASPAGRWLMAWTTWTCTSVSASELLAISRSAARLRSPAFCPSQWIACWRSWLFSPLRATSNSLSSARGLFICE